MLDTCITGGYLVELHARDDFNAFQEWMHDLRYWHGKSSGWVATGAEVVSNVHTNYTYQLQD